MGARALGRSIRSIWSTGAWAATLAHGLSQVFFQTNVLTGLLILAAFVVQDWRMAVLVVLGSTASSAAGRLLGASRTDTRAGCQGFCGALIGASTYAALGAPWYSYPIAIAGGLLCAPVTKAAVRLLETRPFKRFDLPSTTAPFCLVATLIWVGTAGLRLNSPLRLSGTDTQEFFASLFTNISQVVLVDSVWGGALILAGLFIAHWKVGVAAIVGSLVGTVCAIAMHENLQRTANGLSGYSGVLTAIAFAVVFAKGRWVPWAFAVAGAAITAVVTLAMHQLPGPTYTWPYVLTTWLGLVLIHVSPRLH